MHELCLNVKLRKGMCELPVYIQDERTLINNSHASDDKVAFFMEILRISPAWSQLIQMRHAPFKVTADLTSLKSACKVMSSPVGNANKNMVVSLKRQ
ncbi:hypothetical protein CCR75_006429 [Bremia lactucae]|uniref:Uncharacterized protein n=1 Tax=Bremia lactucae TaxID=4779 RepID=A0A976FJM0_BRELC|nr:hypothetical protein CCR75_006429 [Bremia lactucae]